MKQPEPFCPECGLPVHPVEGKTYMATNTWIWKADEAPEESYEFHPTITYACSDCRVTVVFPLDEDATQL